MIKFEDGCPKCPTGFVNDAIEMSGRTYWTCDMGCKGVEFESEDGE